MEVYEGRARLSFNASFIENLSITEDERSEPSAGKGATAKAVVHFNRENKEKPKEQKVC